MNLENKVGLITGATSGIGFESAKRALQSGAKAVVITGQNPERLASAQTELSKFGKVSAIRWRGEEAGDSAQLAEEIKTKYGTLDFVFANAGVCWESPVGKLKADEIQQQLMVNLVAPLMLTEAIVPLMSNGGSITFTTSCLNQLGIPGYAAYSASKAGLRSLARTLSAELKDQNIRVNCIAPGPFETPIHGKNGLEKTELDAAKQYVASLVPLGRFGKTEEIVDAVVFLASDSSRYMLGSELVIDGGWSAL